MTNETIIWRSSGVNAPDKAPTMPSRLSLIGWLLLKLFYAAYLIWLVYWFGKDVMEADDKVAYIQQSLFPIIITVIISVAFIFVMRAVGRLDNDPTATYRIPLWLSDRQLAFSGDNHMSEEVVPLDDIQTIAPDYAQGSPSIQLNLKRNNYMLVSSDRDNLLKHLFSLRPELESPHEQAH